jgi:toxin ParE1/3/4
VSQESGIRRPEREANRRIDATTRRFASAGRPRDEMGPGIRSIVVYPYIVFYQFTDKELVILRIIHGSQNLDVEFHRDSAEG